VLRRASRCASLVDKRREERELLDDPDRALSVFKRQARLEKDLEEAQRNIQGLFLNTDEVKVTICKAVGVSDFKQLLHIEDGLKLAQKKI